MRLYRSFDYKLINEILNMPELFETIAEDCSIEQGSFETTESNSICYMMVEVDDTPIGLFIIHPDSRVSYEIHANILKKYRKDHSKEACDKVVQWVWDNIDTDKINCNIPTIYQNVINRAKETGFVEEGVRTHSYLKNGEALDVMLLGIKRP